MSLTTFNSLPQLHPADAVAAVILTGENSYLLQHRDTKPSIFFPGHWGFFGGGTESGESETDTLVRELGEELGLEFDVSELIYFTRFTFDLGFVGMEPIVRAFYTITLSDDRQRQISLGEGQDVQSFASEHAHQQLKMTPYDAFALWLYANAGRLSSP